MKVSGWLLKIFCSYLKERSMTLTMNGLKSETLKLNGSCPQGVFLGVFFFIIAFNAAFLRPDAEKPLGKEVEEGKSIEKAEVVEDVKEVKRFTAKYIDDNSHSGKIGELLGRRHKFRVSSDILWKDRS